MYSKLVHSHGGSRGLLKLFRRKMLKFYGHISSRLKLFLVGSGQMQMREMDSPSSLRLQASETYFMQINPTIKQYFKVMRPTLPVFKKQVEKNQKKKEREREEKKAESVYQLYGTPPPFAMQEPLPLYSLPSLSSPSLTSSYAGLK